MAKRRRLLSAEACAQEWKTVWDANDNTLQEKFGARQKGGTEKDPFDCSSLVAHEKELVEREINYAITKWRALEDRKIKKQAWGWAMVKIRLPLKFDYQSKLEEAPPATSTDETEQVISLVNPTKTESYETELWKIFKQTRTLEELREVCGLEETLHIKDRMDKTDMSQLRISDRHGLPPPPDGSPRVLTLVLEVWRRNLPGKSTIDSNRMVLEFLEEQTLLDLHTTIQELAVDALWTGGNSGVLFIEDTFYTTGEVDYATSILEWLKEDISRQDYLGLPSKLVTKPMESVKLKSLKWSLNTRYMHIHHGHVESSVFLTDICQTPKHPLPYPIIHDIWTHTYFVALCEGCKQRSATLVTPSACEETDGAAQICQSCHHHLFGDKESKSIDIHVFKQQHDLILPEKTDSKF